MSTITDLNILTGQPGLHASALNDSGQIAGFGASPNGSFLLDSDGTLTDLGSIEGRPFTQAYALNANAQVVGEACSGLPECHPYLYSDGQMSDLGSLGTGGSAVGINNYTQVVGAYSVSSIGPSHAFLWDQGVMSDLTPGLVHESRPYAINDSGQVVGSFEPLPDSFGNHAFLWDSLHGMQDLSTLLRPGDSVARGINASGFVTGGDHTTRDQGYAFLYDGTTMNDLGTLPNFPQSEGWSVNDSGQVVGVVSRLDGHQIFADAFLYSNGTMTDLNDLLPANSGWTLRSAWGINNNGQIIGLGLHDGVGANYLLTLDDGSSPGRPGKSSSPASVDFALIALVPVKVQGEHAMGAPVAFSEEWRVSPIPSQQEPATQMNPASRSEPGSSHTAASVGGHAPSRENPWIGKISDTALKLLALD